MTFDIFFFRKGCRQEVALFNPEIHLPEMPHEVVKALFAPV